MAEQHAEVAEPKAASSAAENDVDEDADDADDVALPYIDAALPW